MQDQTSVWDKETTPAPEAEHVDPVTDASPTTRRTGDGWVVKAEERARQVGEQLKNTARQTSNTVVDVSDQRLQQAASGLDGASAAMRSKADRMAQASEQTAIALRQAADSLRRLRDHSIFQDTADYIRNNPSVALTASVIAGFIVGSVIQTGSLKESVAMLTGRNHEQ